MKTSSVMKPAMLFAAGTIASTAASAAPTVMDVNFEATPDGTEIKLAGSSTAQYRFNANSLEIKEDAFITEYRLNGVGGATVTGTQQSQPFYPTAAEANQPSVKTGSDGGIIALAAADRYYGLRFASNGVDYSGFAGVNQTGNVITQIGFQAVSGAVPEPSTWALMIAGFGGVGLAMRRRRRQAPLAAVA